MIYGMTTRLIALNQSKNLTFKLSISSHQRFTFLSELPLSDEMGLGVLVQGTDGRDMEDIGSGHLVSGKVLGLGKHALVRRKDMRHVLFELLVSFGVMFADLSALLSLCPFRLQFTEQSHAQVVGFRLLVELVCHRIEVTGLNGTGLLEMRHTPTDHHREK